MPTTASTASLPNVQLRISLPAEIVDLYQDQADRTGLEIEQVVAARLLACVDHTSGKPLYFSDADRQELEQLLGRNVLHTKDALLQIRNAMCVRVNKVIISLKTNLLAKLKSRCIGMPFEDFLAQRVVQALEQYVGMR